MRIKGFFNILNAQVLNASPHRLAAEFDFIDNCIFINKMQLPKYYRDKKIICSFSGVEVDNNNKPFKIELVAIRQSPTGEYYTYIYT